MPGTQAEKAEAEQNSNIGPNKRTQITEKRVGVLWMHIVVICRISRQRSYISDAELMSLRSLEYSSEV